MLKVFVFSDKRNQKLKQGSLQSGNDADTKSFLFLWWSCSICMITKCYRKIVYEEANWFFEIPF